MSVPVVLAQTIKGGALPPASAAPHWTVYKSFASYGRCHEEAQDLVFSEKYADYICFWKSAKNRYYLLVTKTL